MALVITSTKRIADLALSLNIPDILLKRFTGQIDEDCRALVLYAVRPDPAVMRLDDLFGDGEAEASAAHLAGTAFIDSIEPFEYAVHLASGDAESVIFDLYRHTVVEPV